MKRVICASDNFSLEERLFEDLSQESTRISQKALDVLNRNGIAGIYSDGQCFWFEYYNRGNDCPQSVYDYLKRYIKRKYGLEYLYGATQKMRAPWDYYK